MRGSVQVADKIADAERVFKVLAENGSVEMPIQQTFFAAHFGMLRDRFGVPWMINCIPAHGVALARHALNAEPISPIFDWASGTLLSRAPGALFRSARRIRLLSA